MSLLDAAEFGLRRRRLRRPRAARSFRPSLHLLEDRCLLAWSPIGPAPIIDSSADYAGNRTLAATGAIDAIAFGQDNNGNSAEFVGSLSGGLFRSTDFTSNTPTWAPLSDFVQSRFWPGVPPLDTVNSMGDSQTGVGAGANQSLNLTGAAFRSRATQRHCSRPGKLALSLAPKDARRGASLGSTRSDREHDSSFVCGIR
jgi:hypothetical protein